MQIPPTPTPMPPGIPRFSMGDDFSLWAGTDGAIQWWNWLGTGGQIVQLLILLVLIAAGIFLTIRFFGLFARRDAEN